MSLSQNQDSTSSQHSSKSPSTSPSPSPPPSQLLPSPLPPPPASAPPRISHAARGRATSWSIFRRHSLSDKNTPESSSSIGTSTNQEPSNPPQPVANDFKPTHTSSASFSFSSIASALKIPLASSPPTATRHLPPSFEFESPTDSRPTIEVSPGADPDPTPSVPVAPPRLVVEAEPADEPIGPFDFNQFLEQMRWRQSEPIAKYLRSFLKEFAKRATYNGRKTSITEQVRVVNDFLDFISVKMREIKGGPWDPKICSEAEFDHAVEAMEKLVMNRVWHLTFTPALPLNLQPSATDDLERDTVLSQKLNLFYWVTDRHLDLELERDESDGFLEFAKTELLKINSYKAPRDKMICILNCCKVIFGLIRHISQSEGGADTFVPILILVVLRARPEHLISNVQFIQRFRNPDKLQGENGYYLSSLNAAISFIERLEHSVLSNISQEEFETNVEQAINSLPRSPTRSTNPFPPDPSPVKDEAHLQPPNASRPPLSGSSSFPDLTRTWLFNTVPTLAEKAVSRPLNAIARIVDDLSNDQEEMRTGSVPAGSQLDVPWPERRPSLQDLRRATSPAVPRRRGSRPWSMSPETRVNPVSSSGGVGIGVGGEDDKSEQVDKQAKLDRLQRAEHEAKLDTLCSIFAELEREVLEVVLVTHNGQLSVAIDSILEMS